MFPANRVAPDKLDRVKTIRYNDINVLVTYKYDYMDNVAVVTVIPSATTTDRATPSRGKRVNSFRVP